MSYFGSVKFFKHLILTVGLLIIIFPYILSVYLVLENKELKNQTNSTYNNISNENHFNLDELLLKTVEASEQISKEKDISTNQEISPYQLKYDDLYVERKMKVKSNSNDKIVYLTFDDGPSQRTLEILDNLDKYNIKATFFVIYKDSEASSETYKEIVNRGHTIGVHSYSHDYIKIYNSVEDYLDDFYKMFKYIYETTGVKPELFRFPGGSINAYNSDNYQEIIAEMIRRGFTYHDWNVVSGDTIKGATKDSIVNCVINGIKDYNKVVILMHDSFEKKYTSESLSNVIEMFQNRGFSFDKLDGTIKPYIFSYIQ
ncbi:peptidoglycan/xylan/chitin deacetylase (PgdA/CDA1 family) [Sedimentibacter acidaminivorans]|uniref:Peptidoglycan/xylan/chitin deacetylase (PgdA/CDA1 family) n=1 Tax=Sedimentibacter acidaminivorans TaxID=913099 RepID=A0ABS4GHA3_9FIRM|nr:polysaccharide deacetylase family protein [Sedimentibacter acidaminivorans]MBP1926987.1 peptidoglycan/xylan/chitin deacetylase (PgdA/CDA1 family) [Sedimentibacter acidaminivorans]